MEIQLKKSAFSLVSLLCLWCLVLTLVWDMGDFSDSQHQIPTPKTISAPKTFKLCKNCKEFVNRILQNYSKSWQKDEDNYQQFKSQLRLKCHGSDNAIITQAKTPVGFKITYDGQKMSVKVNRELYSLFAKEHPFTNKTWSTCSVVGNGGILSDSTCGEMIDSAQLVIRCNIPPLNGDYQKDVGIKTDIVTANPSIFKERFGSLDGRRRPFVESLKAYGNSLLLLPAFSYSVNTDLCVKAMYSIDDFECPVRPVFVNPSYLLDLAAFWTTKGMKPNRLSTGMMMVSLALELCENVDLYGFWPFSSHAYGLHDLMNHYYDDKKDTKGFHAMPTEFELLLKLHSQGIVKLHLGDCQPGTI